MSVCYLKCMVLLPLLLLSLPLLAQEEEEEAEGKHRITLVLGHAHVPEGIGSDGQRKVLVLGSWGLDYDYWLSAHWAVGLHSDFIVENFELEEHFGREKAVIKRSRPLASALVVTYKPGKHLTFLAGGGGEFAKEENFLLIRAGVEYGWELPNEWELGVSLMNDFKIDAYDSWLFGLGVSKFF